MIVEQKPFKKIYLEISNICNLKCSFCPEVERSQFKIEEDIFRDRLSQASELAERVCLHVMGEPLGHPLLIKFLQIADELNSSLEITTNGTLLNNESKQALLSLSVKQVNFSLQSFVDNFPKANPDVYLNKIFDFCESAFEVRPDLYINFRLWNLKENSNHKELNKYFLQKIEQRFDVSINPEVDPAFRKSKKVVHRLYLHFDSRFEWPSLTRDQISQRGRCYGGRNQLAILSEGDVVPCCLDKEAVLKIGNLKDESLKAISQSDRLKRLTLGFSKGELVESLCQRCDYATRFTKL
jgi:radical SAM protein with 4Fe4S-binding SPASM domain